MASFPAELEAKYEVLGKLGAGASGEVVEARDRFIGRRVAIKMVARPAGDERGAAGETFARFRREAKAAGQLVHPNIVSVYDFGEDGRFAWIVMEHVAGGSLKTLLDRGERMPPAEAVRLTQQILEALAFSHAAGVVHRDIKPANVLLTLDGRVKLADFGIAKIEDSSITRVGAVMGTPSYMAPEQVLGEDTDRRTDIWAVGVVVYELLTGEKPFQGGQATVAQRILSAEPIPPSKVSVLLPQAMDAVVARALAKRPDARFERAEDFASALGAALAGSGTLDGGGMAWIAPVAAGGLLLAGLAAFLLWPRPDPAETMVPAPQSPSAPARLPPDAVAITVTPSVAPPPVPDPPTPAGPPLVPPPLAPAPGPAVVVPIQPIAPLPPVDPGAVLREVAAAAPCARLTVGSDRGRPEVSGFAPRGAEARLRAELRERGLAEDEIRFRLLPFDGPYCDLIDVLRPVHAMGAEPGMQVSVVGGTRLRKGDLLRLDVELPAWGGFLVADYVTLSGDVAHLLQLGRQQGGARFRLGEPSGSFTGWEIDEPFGTDLLLLIASEQPLFPLPRAEIEALPAYVSALEVAVAEARRQGARVVARIVPIETMPR